MSTLLLSADLPVSEIVLVGLMVLVPLFGLISLLGIRYIPNNRVGVIEKLWSRTGSLADGRLIALYGEAGFQAELLRGGLHFGYWPWQYRVHKVSMTVVSQGQMGYVFARDGEPLRPEQTLGRVVTCNNFQDTRAFLCGDRKGDPSIGQRGRQRAILREGVYVINPVLFVVITQDIVYRFNFGTPGEQATLDAWRKELQSINAFTPVVIGSTHAPRPSSDAPWEEHAADEHIDGDIIAIITAHDGPSLPAGQIIAPAVAGDPSDANFHNNFQDIEAFLRAGGCRGRQFAPLTDGTYFINRWFASVEPIPKTVVPIGNVGVVVSYYGKDGFDLSGTSFRHGERVADGERGVQAKTLGPGKYPFNTYAGHAYLVPTTNFVLHWITGRTESHRFDESLKSIDLVTADAYEPVLPLSVVVHIDYQKAANVVQRFGDVKKLITQTLDPLLSAYFRDIAHKKTMLQLLHERDSIQAEARQELRGRFAEFDIELVDVLIGKPDTVQGSDIERLLDQLRMRQLAREQVLTFEQQRVAADKLKELKMAQAVAEKQGEITNSQVQIQIAANQGDAELARSRKRAEQSVVEAEADLKRKVLEADAAGQAIKLRAEADAKSVLLKAEAESQSLKLMGDGESQRVALEGEAQASVLAQKIASYGDPRLYALSLVAEHFAQSKQPLVPQRLFVSGGGNANGKGAEHSLFATLMDLMVAEKSGLSPNGVIAPRANQPVESVTSASEVASAAT